MVLHWHFWKQIIDRFTDTEFVFGMMVRSPYEIALSYQKRQPEMVNEIPDVYGVIEGYYRCQLQIIEEYSNRENFTLLPVRAHTQYYKGDIERLLKSVDIQFNQTIFDELFQAPPTLDTNNWEEIPVFDLYCQLRKWCKTATGGVI
jgi:hypothetical protein